MAETEPVQTLKPVVVGLTGASGSILGFRLVKCLLEANQPVEMVLSQKSLPVIHEELDLKLSAGPDRVPQLLGYLNLPEDKAALLRFFDNNDLGAACSSGSHLTRGMVIIPCSMGTLGRIAAGVTDNLVARSADVALKEQRKLILVPRECPLNAIHLKNMLTLSQCGAVILPPMLTFYRKDFHSLDGQINYTIGKVLDHLGQEHTLHQRWGEH